MNKTLLTMAAVGALAAAAPAIGQSVNSNAGVGFSNRIANLETRIDAGVRAGTLDRTEATALRRELRALRRLERQYSRNGLTVQERQDLQMRLRDLRQDVRMASGNAGGGRYDQDGNWIDDDNYGQGGPYEEVDCEPRGGIGGILSSVLGRDDDCGATLRVGQRVTGGLSAVPYQYRYQYRDGNGVYYRSDGRAIYQIDARTHTVLRIYDVDR